MVNNIQKKQSFLVIFYTKKDEIIGTRAMMRSHSQIENQGGQVHLLLHQQTKYLTIKVSFIIVYIRSPTS